MVHHKVMVELVQVGTSISPREVMEEVQEHHLSSSYMDRGQGYQQDMVKHQVSQDNRMVSLLLAKVIVNHHQQVRVMDNPPPVRDMVNRLQGSTMFMAKL